MSNEKAPIPEDLKNRHALLKSWVNAPHFPAYTEEIIQLIERIAALQAEVDALKAENARLKGAVTDVEWGPIRTQLYCGDFNPAAIRMLIGGLIRARATPSAKT